MAIHQSRHHVLTPWLVRELSLDRIVVVITAMPQERQEKSLAVCPRRAMGCRPSESALDTRLMVFCGLLTCPARASVVIADGTSGGRRPLPMTLGTDCAKETANGCSLSYRDIVRVLLCGRGIAGANWVTRQYLGLRGRHNRFLDMPTIA